jgi:hypothetical protein
MGWLSIGRRLRSRERAVTPCGRSKLTDAKVARHRVAGWLALASAFGMDRRHRSDIARLFFPRR